MRTLLSLAVIGVVVMAANAHAAGERLLFDNFDYDVLVAEDYYCDQPVKLTVLSADPEMFEADSPELQRIVDAAQAVLAFECPIVHGVELEGRLAGLDEPVYFGVAGPGSSWELAAKQSIHSEEYEAYQAPIGHGEYESADRPHGFTVASLSAGMSVDEARAAAADTFGIEPEYDVENGILTLQSGGCPADYDWEVLSPSPEPGWKCLQAWFTDQRLSRLYLLDLLQVVEFEDPEAVEQYLIDRFGEPAYRGTRKQDRAWWQDKQAIYTMGWGEVVETGDAVGGEQTEIYNLQAQVLSIKDATMVKVTLYEPGLQPQRATGDDPRVPDLTL